MKIRVVDFETSDMVGKGRPVELCEVGYTDLVGGNVLLDTFASFVNPGIPITPEARGVHHITDREAASGMPPDDARDLLMGGMEPGDMFAAHNAAFERALFPGDPYPWICTMQCAKHLWEEEAPGFSNQTLRYWLDLDKEFSDPALAMPPHRAGPDTFVTAHILRRLLVGRSPETLVDLTAKPVLLKICTIGDAKGLPWSQVDRGLLEWCLKPGRNLSPEILATARHWLDELNRPADRNFLL